MLVSKERGNEQIHTKNQGKHQSCHILLAGFTLVPEKNGKKVPPFGNDIAIGNDLHILLTL